jgi:hypothetical protein
MRVELLFWDGCPSHPEALAELRGAMVDVALDPSRVVVREVQTQAGGTKDLSSGETDWKTAATARPGRVWAPADWS